MTIKSEEQKKSDEGEPPDVYSADLPYDIPREKLASVNEQAAIAAELAAEEERYPLGRPAPSYTREQLTKAVDEAHEALHDWESQAGPGHPLHGAVSRAHEALHAVGAGMPRAACSTPDPEVQEVVRDFLGALKKPLPCGHEIADLVSGAETITFCGACAEAVRGAPPATRYQIRGRLRYETADRAGHLEIDGGTVDLDELMTALQPDTGFLIDDGAEVTVSISARGTSSRARPAGLGPCIRCKPGAIVPLVALVSDDGSAWEAEACPTCRCRWWNDPPKLPGQIPPGAARTTTSAFKAETDRIRGDGA